MTLTTDSDGLFMSQKYVDQYLEDTEDLVADMDTEEKAVSVLKRVKYLNYVSDEFFVPNMVGAWEEMALSYIESPRALFQNVHYDIVKEERKNFFDATRKLELAVLDGLLPEETLFNMVYEFNHNIDQVNVDCERYNMMKFGRYWFNSDLGRRYEEWLKN